MEKLLGLLYLIVAGHLLDASINYARDLVMLSTIINVVLMLVCIFVGVSLLI